MFFFRGDREGDVGSKRTFREFYIAELLVVTRPNE